MNDNGPEKYGQVPTRETQNHLADEKFRILMQRFDAIDYKLKDMEMALYNKIRIKMILDVNDDKVHIAKQIVKLYETPDGVIVHVK